MIAECEPTSFAMSECCSPPASLSSSLLLAVRGKASRRPAAGVRIALRSSSTSLTGPEEALVPEGAGEAPPREGLPGRGRAGGIGTGARRGEVGRGKARGVGGELAGSSKAELLQRTTRLVDGQTGEGPASSAAGVTGRLSKGWCGRRRPAEACAESRPDLARSSQVSTSRFRASRRDMRVGFEGWSSKGTCRV